MEITGRRVLVTGASKGIGRLMAHAFARKGAVVALAARSRTSIEDLADELGGVAYPVDLADPHEVDGFIERVQRDGEIDILVNNAAVEHFGHVGDLDSATVDRITSLNLATPIKLTAQVVPGMVRRGGGHIVQVSSMTGVISTPGSTVYSATKAGLSHATACLQLELRRTSVTLTSVMLGGIDNDMGHRVAGTEMIAPLMKRFRAIGLDRLADPVEAADRIVHAVETGRRHLVYPGSARPMAGLVNAPRRVMEMLTRGLTFRPDAT
jgi:short-subunit dehydrogenase